MTTDGNANQVNAAILCTILFLAAVGGLAALILS